LLVIQSLLLQLLLQEKLLLISMINHELFLLQALNWLLHNHILLVLLIDKMRLEKLLLLFNKNHRTSLLDEVLLLVNILIKRLILLYLNWLEFDLLHLLKDQSRLLFLVAVSKVLDNILLNLFYNRMRLLLMNALLN
jgi:hypothetical protein